MNCTHKPQWNSPAIHRIQDVCSKEKMNSIELYLENLKLNNEFGLEFMSLISGPSICFEWNG